MAPKKTKTVPQPPAAPQNSAKRGLDAEVASDQEELSAPGTKRTKKEKDFKDFKTIRGIIDTSHEGRQQPEEWSPSYIDNRLNEMADVYPLDRDEKTEAEAKKCGTWAKDYVKFLVNARERLVDKQGNPHYPGVSSQKVAKVIERIDTELKKGPVEEASKKLPAKATTIAEACKELEGYLNMWKTAQTDGTQEKYRGLFRTHYKEYKESMREDDPQWKEYEKQIKTFKSEHSKIRAGQEDRLPSKDKDPEASEKALRAKYLRLLKKMHEIEYKFFTGDWNTDFKSLQQERKKLGKEKRTIDRDHKSELRELAEGGGLLPPDFEKDSKCLGDAFIAFLRTTNMKGKDDREKSFKYFNKVSELEKKVEGNPDDVKAGEELKELQAGLPGVVTNLLKAREKFLEKKGNEDLVKLLSEMKSKRQGSSIDSTEADSAMLEWDAGSGPMTRLEDWGITKDQLDDVSGFLLDYE